MWRDPQAALRAARAWLGRWQPRGLSVRAIRGATTVDCDSRDAVLEATRELLEEIARRNRLAPSAIISVIFTSTPDLTSVFPAEAGRTLGWRDVPLLGAVEVPVPGAPARCIRALLHVHGRRPATHVYIRGAARLRPDLTAA